MNKGYRKGNHIVGGHGTVIQKLAPFVDDVARARRDGADVKISLRPIDPRCGGAIDLKVEEHNGYADYVFRGSGKQRGQLRGDHDAIAKVLERWGKRCPQNLAVTTVSEA